MASDLHTHTNFSDGSLTPEELLDKAKNIGLKYLAITDHDTVDGVKYIYENGIYPEKKLKIIFGVEFSALNPDYDVHIVGYNIDIYNGALSDMINEIIEARWIRFTEIIKNLQNKKYNIKEADVLQVTGSSRSIGRAHIARALVKKGMFKNLREVFEKMLGKGKPAYAPRYFPEVDEVVDVIRQAGGKAMLAHPGIVGSDSLVEELCRKVDALEVYYPTHKPIDIQKYLGIAKKFNLMVGGGSDFHGIGSKYVDNLGDYTIPDEIAEKFFIKQ
ncbi:MAG: PHP domain-containing protein [Selenomonadaceae bacterium]|nr:PHP domain-containing protein [Selenomonadaceae bacterium]